MLATTDWNLACFDVDRPSDFAARFLSTLLKREIQKVFPIPPHEFSPSTREYVTAVTECIRGIGGKVLTIYGSGSFHHFTYGLVKNIADAISSNYAYIHIDQHTDDRWPEAEQLSSGSFVGQISLKHTVAAVRYIGCEQIMNTKTPTRIILQNKTINELGVKQSLTSLLEGTPQDVYVSIDLDVLKKNEMLTRWSEGEMSIDTLIEIIAFLKNNKNIISADILGHGSYHVPFDVDEKPDLSDALRKKINHTNMLVYAIVVGTFLGIDISTWKQEHGKLASEDLHKYLNQ